MKKKFFWEIFNYYALLILLSLMFLLFTVNLMMRELLYKQTGQELLGIAEILEYNLHWKSASDYPHIQELCTRLGAGKRVRITVVLGNGVVIGDSENDLTQMENHAARLEVHQALMGRTGTDIRTSATLAEKMLYLAIPVYNANVIQGVLRVSRSIKYIDDILITFNLRTLLAGIVILCVSLVISIFIARKIDKPVLKLEKAARAYATGNFNLKIHIDKPDELRTLGSAMNRMAEELEGRIAAIESQKCRLEAILSNMVEPVFLLNEDLLITRFNKAAMELFLFSVKDNHCPSLIEAVRNVELYDFARQALVELRFQETTIMMKEDEEIHLQVHATPLLRDDGFCDGLLLVMNNITRLVKLENVRRDFVANVSHELKTPITAIRGFVETLGSGALDDPEKSTEYLQIIGKQSDRLNRIVDDLLQLSRLEETEQKSVEKKECDLTLLIDNAVHNCEQAAAKQGVSVSIKGRTPFPVPVNSFLIEQAVTNLLDNAIKYSSAGGQVFITYEPAEKPGYFRITIADKGCGIPPLDLRHIFERFYRVDKARSRALGGTGLGLAIVKHIAQVHGGEAVVESVLGMGSSFTLILPF